MDIKDFILLVGCLLITAVICHGLWIAWRTRNEALPFDIGDGTGDRTADAVATFREVYEAELPNGGARPAADRYGDYEGPRVPRQESLLPDLAADEHRAGSTPDTQRARAAALTRADEELLGRPPVPEPQPGDLFQDPISETDMDASSLGDDATAAAAREMGVTEVELPADEDPLTTENRQGRTSAATTAASSEPTSRPVPPPANEPLEDQPVVDDAPDDLIVIQLLAPEGETFAGNVLCASLRQHGLRYGEKGLFHRLQDPKGEPLFSVVNIIEPGFFDLGQLDALNTPGIAFFMTLPGPAEPMKAFDDMVRVARRLAGALNGRLVDDSRNLFTAQTQSHLRERVAGYRLKHYNRKAL